MFNVFCLSRDRGSKCNTVCSLRMRANIRNCSKYGKKANTIFVIFPN